MRIMLNISKFMGEDVLIQNLAEMNIPRSCFRTEEEQRSMAKESDALISTPDILFSSPIQVFGRTVHWIDAKNSFISPECSAAKIIQDLLAQTQRYKNEHGCGAILWTKCGFSESIQLLLEAHDTLCLRTLDSDNDYRKKKGDCR